MKLNFHRKRLYLYVNFMELDSYKIIGFFEDYDETSVNYDYNCKTKGYEFNLDIKEEIFLNNDSSVSNFYEDFFLIK